MGLFIRNDRSSVLSKEITPLIRKMKKYLLIFLIILSFCSLSAYLTYSLTEKLRSNLLSYSDKLAAGYIDGQKKNLAKSTGYDENCLFVVGLGVEGRWRLFPESRATEDRPPQSAELRRQLDQLRDKLIEEMSTFECTPDIDVSWEEYRQDCYKVTVRYKGVKVNCRF